VGLAKSLVERKFPFRRSYVRYQRPTTLKGFFHSFPVTPRKYLDGTFNLGPGRYLPAPFPLP